MAIPKVTIPPSVSAQSNPEINTRIPHFPVCELLDLAERVDFDDTDWQDYLNQYADCGVR